MRVARYARTLDREWVPVGTSRRMEVDLWCPQCEEQVLDARTYTVGQQQHATCPQCHAELVRHPHVEDNTWKVEKSPPLADEELVSRVSGRRVLGQEQLERPEAQRL